MALIVVSLSVLAALLNATGALAETSDENGVPDDPGHILEEVAIGGDVESSLDEESIALRLRLTGLQPTDEVVEAYADQYGITIPESYAILTLHESVSMAMPDIEELVGVDNYAKMEFVPGRPEFVIHVMPGTTVGREQVEALLADELAEVQRIGNESIGTIRIKEDGAVSVLDRVSHANETGELLDPLTGDVVGTAHISVPMSHACSHLTGGAADGGRLFIESESTRVLQDRNSSKFDGTCAASNGAAGCTTTFSATRLLASGAVQEGIVTAGHCVDTSNTAHIWNEMYARNLSETFAIFRRTTAYDEFQVDAAFMRETYGSTTLTSDIYLDEEHGFRTMTRHIPGAPADNSVVCMKGANSVRLEKSGWEKDDDTAGLFCGEVIDNHQAPRFRDHWNWAQVRILDRYYHRNRGVVNGDSGGPVFLGETLYGLATHADSDRSKGVSMGFYSGANGTVYGGFYFMHADEIEDELGIEWNVAG